MTERELLTHQFLEMKLSTAESQIIGTSGWSALKSCRDLNTLVITLDDLPLE
jgi:hypothetical protein